MITRRRPEPTLTEALRAAGYGHRACPQRGPSHGQCREVYEVVTGRIIGCMRVDEAWAWLRGLS